MKIVSRKKQADQPPGLTGTARVDRQTRHLIPRLRPGDIAVIDHLDLDRTTAAALVGAGVSAVVNAGPFISGRYANLGPQVLAEAGVLLVESAGAGALEVKDGARIRVDEGRLHQGDRVVAEGVEVDGPAVHAAMVSARRGMLAQLATFTANSREFLQREEALLLHGEGLPDLGPGLRGKPVVVSTGEGDADRALRRYQAEQHPVLIAVGTRAAAQRSGRGVDVLVLDQFEDLPDAKTVTAAGHVVLRVEHGAAKSVSEPLERLGVQPHRVETSASASDLGLQLAAALEAPLVIAAGMDASLEEFLDSRRQGLASTFLTRLKVGHRLVDAHAVPLLYSGRVRPRHLLVLVLVCLIALGAAISVTPVGHEWAHQCADAVRDLYDSIQGKFS